MNLQTLRCWAEVDLNAIAHNVNVIREHAGRNKLLIGVVKADAYGHGVHQVVGTLRRQGVELFGVANVTEALEVKQRFPALKIMLFSAALPSEYPEMIKFGIQPTLSQITEFRALNKLCKKLRKHLTVHLKIDTGMGRLGLFHKDFAANLRKIGQCENLSVASLYTHLAAAESDRLFTMEQIEAFKVCLGQWQNAGLPLPLVHCANSAGILNFPHHTFDALRPGISIYGSSPVKKFEPLLIPVMTFKSRMTFVRTVPKGTTLSYGHSYTCPRSMRIATISAGYADGYMRGLSNKGFCYADGIKCPVLGRVTMDQIIIDVTKVRSAKIGSEVLLFGREGNTTLRADVLADLCGTISYEIFTGISKRVTRVYKK